MGSSDRQDISEPIFLMFGSLHQLLYGSAKANLGSLLNEQKTLVWEAALQKKVMEVKNTYPKSNFYVYYCYCYCEVW